MKLTMQIQKLNADQTGTASPRTYTNINNNYIGLAPYSTPPALPFFRTYSEEDEEYTDMQQAQSFAQWVNVVARSLMSLSTEHYLDTAVIGTFSVTEELNQ